jgi:hypothetical protein
MRRAAAPRENMAPPVRNVGLFVNLPVRRAHQVMSALRRQQCPSLCRVFTGHPAMNNIHRRRWKLAVIRALTAKGYHVATVRRTIGVRVFADLMDEAFEAAPSAPLEGARIMQEKLEDRYGHLLERPVTPWSRK